MKIEILITIYRQSSSSQLALLEGCLEHALDLELDPNLILLIDPECPKLTEAYLMQWYYRFPNRIFLITRPPNLGHAESLQWWYNQSDADYLFINDYDDWSLPGRIEYSIKALQETQCGLCFCGYVLSNPTRSDIDFLRIIPTFGFNVGYPSCWAFDKKLVPRLHWDNPFKLKMHYDCYFLWSWLQTKSLVCITNPLVIYHYHAENVSSSLNFQAEFQNWKAIWENNSSFQLYPIIYRNIEDYKPIQICELPNTCNSMYAVRSEHGITYPQWVRGYGLNNYFDNSIDCDWEETEKGLYVTEQLLEHKPLILDYSKVVPFQWTPRSPKFESMMKAFDYAQTLPIYIKLPPIKLIIAGYSYNQEALYLRNEFRKLGLLCDIVGTDSNTEHLCPQTHVFHNMNLTEKHAICQWAKPIELVQHLPYTPDILLIMQSDLPLDLKGLEEIPQSYYASEIGWQRWPTNAHIKSFLYAYYGATEYYKQNHTLEYNQCTEKRMITYAWSPEQYPSKQTNRPIFFGFMGSIGSPGQQLEECPNQNYILEHVRDWRVKYISFAIKWLGLQTVPKRVDAEYIEYMHKVSLTINIPGFGLINQRQFHAMGLGCILVQYWYKGLDQLGFIHKTNCLLFKNKWELVKCILWAKFHPKQIEQIRQAGIKLAQQHTYAHRAKEFIPVFMNLYTQNKTK